MYTHRHCFVCHTMHPAPIWFYQENAGERRYICLKAYLDRPSEQDLWRRMYEPD